MLLQEVQQKNCSNHVWKPVVSMTNPVSAWAWRCVVCNELVLSKPDGMDGYISLRDLEAMVDSSLRMADYVVIDDHSVKGDLWLMRNSWWRYFPVEVQVLYHIFGGVPFVVLFRYRTCNSNVWKNIKDTAGYRALLVWADSVRLKTDGVGFNL